MSTMRDVAEEANVSITTVSHVINGTRFVSEELSNRVQKAMKKLNYRPNILARGLRVGKTNTIGLIVPDNSNPFFAEIARVVEDVGFDSGYSVILCNSDGDLDKELSYIDVLLAKQVDGVIFIASSSQTEHLSLLIRNDLPMVVADRESPNLDVDCVLVDNFRGGYEATRYLLELGHRRIGCIAGPSDLTPSAERVGGYRQALSEFGVPVDEELIVRGDFHFEGGKKAMHKLISLPNRPSAVFVCNDVMAIGAMGIARSAGLKIPDELSIVGFDNIIHSSVTWPPLTTVAQPIEDLAQMSTELLLQTISGSRGAEKKRIVLETELVIRDSCKEYRGYE
jgi:LacI family transcriptional regulator